LENLSDFSRRFNSLLKFIKDSNVKSGLGFLALLCWELDVGTIGKIVHNIQASSMQKLRIFGAR
jgi:hypothetical protein